MGDDGGRHPGRSWRPLGELAMAGALSAGVLVLEVSEAVMASVTRRCDNPQAVTSVIEQRFTALEMIDPAAAIVWMALEQVCDPGNLGTITLNVDAAGTSAVILVGNNIDPYGIEAVRATMGSLFYIGLVRAEPRGFPRLAAVLPRPLVGHLSATAVLRRLDHREPMILIMGNEPAGLSDAMAAACDRHAKLPLPAAPTASIWRCRRGSRCSI